MCLISLFILSWHPRVDCRLTVKVETKIIHSSLFAARETRDVAFSKTRTSFISFTRLILWLRMGAVWTRGCQVWLQSKERESKWIFKPFTITFNRGHNNDINRMQSGKKTLVISFDNLDSMTVNHLRSSTVTQVNPPTHDWKLNWKISILD